MARGINKVILVGNLGNDPEVRYNNAGAAIANISVATTRKWKDKNSGESQEETEWHKVALFNKLGEIAGEYLKKGSQVYIEGRLKTRKWQDQSGQDKYSTEIVANELQMLGGVSNGGQMGSQAPKPPKPEGAQQQPAPSNDFDDDIPFLGTPKTFSKVLRGLDSGLVDKGKMIENNCLAASLATLFDIPIHAVPVFSRMEKVDWYSNLKTWLSLLGFSCRKIITPIAPEGYSIAIGKHPEATDVMHAVLVKDGEFFHDPDANGKYIECAEWFIEITKTLQNPNL